MKAYHKNLVVLSKGLKKAGYSHKERAEIISQFWDCFEYQYEPFDYLPDMICNYASSVLHTVNWGKYVQSQEWFKVIQHKLLEVGC